MPFKVRGNQYLKTGLRRKEFVAFIIKEDIVTIKLPLMYVILFFCSGSLAPLTAYVTSRITSWKSQKDLKGLTVWTNTKNGG
jgi:hypothetical protein